MRRILNLAVVPLVVAVALVATAAADEKPASPRSSTDHGASTARAARPSASDAAKAEAKKRAVLARPAPRSLDEALRRLAAIRVDVDFRDIEVTEAVAYIGRIAGFNVIVGPELQRDGLDNVPRITFKLRQASLRTVADLIARFTGTSMALDGGILSFTTPEAARGKPLLRIFSIAELTAVIRNFPGPDLNLRPSGAEFEEEEITEVENPYADPEKLVDMIKEFVASETWEDDDVSISADSRKLVVRQYPAVQRKIARFLALLRATR